MFKGLTTLVEYEECIQRGLCQEHLKEIDQKEFTAMKDEFPRKAFKFVRINILYPILFKKPSKCEKIKRLMEKTPPIAEILAAQEPAEHADVILVIDSVIVFTLCQLSRICCIGAVFHTIKKLNCDDVNIKAIQNLLLVERFENTDIRHFYPVLLKNFTGCDLDIIRATHCITLLFIRKFCNKPDLNTAIENIEDDFKKKANTNTTVLTKEYKRNQFYSKLTTCTVYPLINFYSSSTYLNAAVRYFEDEQYKMSALYSYLAICADDTSSKAYFKLFEALHKLNQYQDVIAVVNYAYKHAKKDSKFYKALVAAITDKKSTYMGTIIGKEFLNNIAENSINHTCFTSTGERISKKNDKSMSNLVDLVDSDSAESDCEVSKDVPELADSADSEDEDEIMDKRNDIKENGQIKSTDIFKTDNTLSEDQKTFMDETEDHYEQSKSTKTTETEISIFEDTPELTDAVDSDDASETMEKKPNEIKEKKCKSSGANKKKRTVSEGSSADIQQEEEIDVNKVTSFLKEASEAVLADCGYKAVQIFRGPLRSFMESSNPLSFEECDIVCIKYSYGIAYCKSGGYEDLQKCITILKDIIENHDSITFPAAYYSIGLACRKLNRFKEALNYLEIVQSFLCKGIHFKVYPWPGMTTVIQETKPDILKVLVEDLIKECENPPNPDAFCRYENCSFQPTIYYTDPDFKGYLSLSCSEQCTMQYHAQCWKSMKEEKDLTDKEFLEKTCFTPDCEGFIVKIQNIDKKGDLSKEFTSEFKKPSKQKWAKWEKKTDIKEKEKKKKKANMKSEDGSQEVLNEIGKVSSRKSSVIEDECPSQFSSSSCSFEESAPSKSESGMKPSQDELVKEKVEINTNSSNTSSSLDDFGLENPVFSSVPESTEKLETKLMDEDNSKYLLTEIMKKNVYSFMADFLQHHGPLKIDDPILTNALAAFPEEVQDVICEYGGIGEFLKADLRFGYVHNRCVCIISDLGTAYSSNYQVPNSTDFKNFQSQEDAEESKSLTDFDTKTRRSSIVLNPEAVEYTPSSTNMSSSFNFITSNSLPQKHDSNFSLPATFDAASKCSNNWNTGTHLNTFPESDMLSAKSKSETILNCQLQRDEKPDFTASSHLKLIDKVTDRLAYKNTSKLPSDPVDASSRCHYPSVNQSFINEINRMNVCDLIPDCNDASSKFQRLENVLLPLLYQYFSKEMNTQRQSGDSVIKSYLIRQMSDMAASDDLATDIKCLEKNKNSEPVHPDQENIVHGLKTEIFDLSKKHSELQDELERIKKQKQKLTTEVTCLQKSLNEASTKIEILQKECKKKEQDLMMGRKEIKSLNVSIEKMKEGIVALTEERNGAQKTVVSLTLALEKKEEEKKNALEAKEKKFTATVLILQKENAGLKSKAKSAELQVLHMKKTEYMRRIEEKTHEAVERSKEMNTSMAMMAGTGALNPMLHNCIKMLANRLITYVNELNTIKLDFGRKMDELIKKVDNGASLEDLTDIEMVELPVVPSWKNTFPNGPLADKSPFNSMASSFNLGYKAGTSAQPSSAAIASSTTAPPSVLAPGISTSKISPPAAVKASSAPSVISAPSAATTPSITPPSTLPMSSVTPVLEANKINKMDISNDIDITSLTPTIQESYKSAMASINSFASSPYPGPAMDDEFDKKCVVFKHPDPISSNKLELPKAPPPGLLNSIAHCVPARAAALSPAHELLCSSEEKISYGNLDPVPKIDPVQSTWDLEGNNVNSAMTCRLQNSAMFTASNPKLCRIDAGKKKASAASKNSYEKLLKKLKEQNPIYTQEELISFVKEFRDKRQGKLSGLPMDTIISEISAIIKAKKKVPDPKVQPKSTKVLVNKKLVPDPKPPTVAEQQCSKKKTAWNIDTDSQRKFTGSADDDCTICYESMTDISAYKVGCGHAFHENCIRQWLKNKSNCPVCRVLLLLPEEYPSLS